MYSGRSLLLKTSYNDPVVMYQVNSEKYHLALICLNHILPRAEMLDELVNMCWRLTFASRSRERARELGLTCKNMLHSGVAVIQLVVCYLVSPFQNWLVYHSLSHLLRWLLALGITFYRLEVLVLGYRKIENDTL